MRANYLLIFHNDNLNKFEKLILLDLLRLVDERRMAWIEISQSELSQDCSIPKGSLKRYIKSLHEKGYIDRKTEKNEENIPKYFYKINKKIADEYVPRPESVIISIRKEIVRKNPLRLVQNDI